MTAIAESEFPVPQKRETMSELYAAVKSLLATGAPPQKVPLVKSARVMQARAWTHAIHMGIRIKCLAHEGHLYIRRTA